MVDQRSQKSKVSVSAFDPSKHLPENKIIIVLEKVPLNLPAVLNVTTSEWERSTKLVREEDRQAFLYRHHLLRTWLSHWLNKLPTALFFETNPFGKPYLPDTEIQFNMSRCQDNLAFIFAPVMAGIDIEILRDPAPFLPIAKRFFHPEEQELISKGTNFFDIWTRKEAILKAQGIGLFDGLASVDCSKNTLFLQGHNYFRHTFKTPNAVISAAFENKDLPVEIFEEMDSATVTNI